ncbi:MAG: Fe-S-containing hydro-lyase [Proteobacteria bacterium]|nr:Fe-S-containing hydro-lyase [Pseudomonadota bacterium]MBU2251845.1 Fe-S-containing hydro-lyase [Pseudomonadota bacterium]MBU4074068.1 Fe-S-containing hydro-lyase [Pseudomonadota bacterium]MBU4121031.1 Fe-S-containing hydro-lyase [Pseudomonadota bacterium]
MKTDSTISRNITLPLSDDILETLHAGDELLLTGAMYVGRDAAHKRMIETLQAGEPLPVDLKGQVIYFMGPTPARPGKAIGSAGPTSSYRMDAYSPRLMAEGLKGMIGKGMRSKEVKEAMKKHKAVYLGAIGGAGALFAGCIRKVEVVAYDDLGPEALRRIEVRDFPVTVVNDIYGGDIYEEGRAQFRVVDQKHVAV